VRIESLDVPLAGGQDGECVTREIPDTAHDPGQQIERDLLAEPLQRALDSLAADFRLVLILTDIEEISYEEVSQILGCPIGTVRSRLHRARMQVRKELDRLGFKL
jgi:RNA polymerase sigma-70 factor (ECF subfamily)